MSYQKMCYEENKEGKEFNGFDVAQPQKPIFTWAHHFSFTNYNQPRKGLR